MAVLLVTYDLNKEAHRPKILEEIRKGSWQKLSESSYVIETDENPEQVYVRLQRCIDSNDIIYVITLKRPYWGWGPEDVNEWLDARVTY
jgi:CRISPR/Cas system-associated endoribonuclease Cas2